MKPEDTRSVQELVQVVARGIRPKYVFFWSHRPKVLGRVDHSCLSNWFPTRFTLNGLEYPTTEHYMMAEKARLFGDEINRQQILRAKSPSEAKSLGRKVSHFDEGIWKEQRFEIVVTGNEAKFLQNEELGVFLRRTSSKVLVEASPQDRIWGIGMGKNHEKAENPLQWKGLNLLGFALMEVRERLLKKQS